MRHADTKARTGGFIPNLTLRAPVQSELDAIMSGAEGDQLVVAAFKIFAAINAVLRPLEDQLAPVELRPDVRFAELVVRATIRERFGATDVYPRRVKFIASAGRPLGICVGPIAVRSSSRWVLAPRAGIGCGRVFVQKQKGNRSHFPAWCPKCNARGQEPARAKAALVKWAETYDRHGEQIRAVREGTATQIQQAWPRELWRLAELHQRREARKLSGLG